jgi:hypothetical protein
MSDLFEDPTWADQVINGASEGSFGPYVPIPGEKRLMLVEEIVRQDPSDSPSRGWITVRTSESLHRVWCSAGSENFFLGNQGLKLIVPEAETPQPIPRNRQDTIQEVIAGRAFVFRGDVYLLPRAVLKAIRLCTKEPRPVGYRYL